MVSAEIRLLKGRRMSALGQKQTLAVQQGVSALPPKADIASATRRVRFTHSGHWQCTSPCLLCANSGHPAIAPRLS